MCVDDAQMSLQKARWLPVEGSHDIGHYTCVCLCLCVCLYVCMHEYLLTYTYMGVKDISYNFLNYAAFFHQYDKLENGVFIKIVQALNH